MLSFSQTGKKEVRKHKKKLQSKRSLEKVSVKIEMRSREEKEEREQMG